MRRARGAAAAALSAQSPLAAACAGGSAEDAGPTERLFDLEVDPREHAPARGTPPHAWLARALDDFERAFARPLASATTEEMQAVLEALGYVDGDQ